MVESRRYDMNKGTIAWQIANGGHAGERQK